MSIVLVVIAMLLGGAMAGKNMIRSAELRMIISESQNYKNATEIFRKKYGSLPGDMYNATSYWGSATCAASTGTGTCNGNGDGKVAIFTENYLAWEHLGLSGLINGTYSGKVTYTSYSVPVAGTDVPKSGSGSGLWQFANLSQLSSTALGYTDLADVYNNYLIFTAVGTTSWVNPAALTPPEAWEIDTKVDDGKPAFGYVRGGYNSTCATALTSSASYLLTSNSKVCLLGFIF